MGCCRIWLRAPLAWVALIISASAVGQGTDAAAPTAKKPPPGDPNRTVQILQEPRHRLVHRDGEIYVLDIQINPGDMTLQHTHDAAILYVIRSTTDPSGHVFGNTDYVTKNLTHQVSNEGPGLFHIIALTTYGPPVADLKADRPTGMSGDPEVENPWLRAYAMTLAPRQEHGTADASQSELDRAGTRRPGSCDARGWHHERARIDGQLGVAERAAATKCATSVPCP